MILHGRNLIIKADGVAIAAAKSCTIEVKAKTLEVSSPNDGGWDHSIVGRKSWSVSTNQLVMSLARQFSLVGTTVSINVQIANGIGPSFSGFCNNVTLQSGTLSTYPTSILWDKTRKQFVYMKSPAQGLILYYSSWSGDAKYRVLNEGDVFITSYNGLSYTYYNGDLHMEKLTGNANVTAWRVTGTVGNLCQGSFQFNGNGELAAAALPST